MKILDPKRDAELLRAVAEATRQQRIADGMTRENLIPTYETLHGIIRPREVSMPESLISHQGGSLERR